jgi:hypothetical protein
VHRELAPAVPDLDVSLSRAIYGYSRTAGGEYGGQIKRLRILVAEASLAEDPNGQIEPSAFGCGS